MNLLSHLIEPTTLRLERMLPGPIERVWAYLFESDKRAEWFAGGIIEPRVGAPVKLTFDNDALSDDKDPAQSGGDNSLIGTVTRFDPPRLIAYTWNSLNESSEVMFELAAAGDRVKLTLTHYRLPTSRGTLLSVSSGWDVHTGILEDRLAGRTPRGFWSTYEALKARYADIIPA